MTKAGSNGDPASDRSTQKTQKPGWFAKGQSGNLGGRPRRSSRGAATSAFDILRDKTLTVTESGRTREISMEEALQRRTYQDAIAGKRMAMREVIKWIKTRMAWFAKHRPPQDVQIKTSPDPDNADAALLLLGIAMRTPERPDLREPSWLFLEPWAVQMALRRNRIAASLTEGNRAWIQRCTRDADTLVFPGFKDR
jgi:Family of unknown function (DUF5681)